ncbi:MAG TPA: hypothetical protein VG872_11430 [Acidimicrobiia bacterium]|nr:hypothetical protein [Acidimicrobiia bacterium]
MSLESRPEAPDPHLLEEALASLAVRSQLEPEGLRWRLDERMERRRSTVFALTLESPAASAVATAFYKAPFLPAELQDERRLSRLRDVVIRSQTLGDEFAERTADIGVAVNVVLAFDLSTFESVTLGLEGRPMGSPLRHLRSRAGRRDAVEACFRVGRAVSILETLGHDETTSADIAAARKTLRRKADRANSYLSSEEVTRLQVAMDRLLDEAVAGGMPVAHGDLSPTNVLMMKGRTGIIDFIWARQVPGYDLARFVHRLRHSTLGWAPWTERLVEATLHGYGNREILAHAGWRFAHMSNLLTALQRFDRLAQMGRGAARKALSELRVGLAEIA